MSDVTRLRPLPSVSTELVEHLESLLQMAKRGELRSLTYFGDVVSDATDGPGNIHDTVGTTDAPSAIFAFECWKAAVIEHTKR